MCYKKTHYHLSWEMRKNRWYTRRFVRLLPKLMVGWVDSPAEVWKNNNLHILKTCVLCSTIFSMFVFYLVFDFLTLMLLNSLRNRIPSFPWRVSRIYLLSYLVWTDTFGSGEGDKDNILLLESDWVIYIFLGNNLRLYL